MSISVRIPTPLRKLTDGADEVSVEATNVGELIDNLEAAHAGLKDRLCDEAGEIRRFVNVYVNDEDVRFLQGKETKLSDGDQVSIVPAIAGVLKQRFYLTFSKENVRAPIIWKLGREFPVVTNIRTAEVKEDMGLVGIELEGEAEAIEAAVRWLDEQHVHVEPIEQNVIEG